MSQVQRQVAEAIAESQRIVAEECGACRQNCCHQGTMLGVHGLQRLEKGLRLDGALAERFRAEMNERRAEIAWELEVAQKVAELLAATHDTPADVAQHFEIRKRLRELREFVEFLSSDYPLTASGMAPLLRYTALRSNLLRLLRQFTGAEAALATLSGGRGSFRFRGRKIAPPRCIIHTDRCLAERWKPIKCADFFCTSEPNLLARLREAMGFDRFAMSNMDITDADRILRAIKLENELGPAYWEPKVIISDLPEQAPSQPAFTPGGFREFGERVVRLLHEGRPHCEVHAIDGRFMKSTREMITELEALMEGSTLVYICDTVDAVALYELAVALDRMRNENWQSCFVLLAERFAAQSFMPHPLWDDGIISQPLGGLDIFLLPLVPAD